jgi:hypothetical protein
MTKAVLFLAGFALLVGVNGAAQAADVRCARLDDNDAVVEYRVFRDIDAKMGGWEAGSCPPSIEGKGVKWLPAPEPDVLPSHDPATQVVEGPTVIVEKDQVTTSYAVRDKTADELDGEKDARIDKVDTFVLKTLCDHESRIRTLEGKGEITLSQCRAAIKERLGD